ncbi:MAG: RagB/SusD family nutrient uptake outer membrane protein [Balneola sp.]
MKKSMILKKVMLVLLVAGFTACTEILEDVEPSTAISFETALSTPAGINGLRTSMYDKVLGNFGYTTQYLIGPGALADETFNRPGSTRFQGLNNAVGTSGTAHLGVFGASFDIIQDANIIINEIPDDVISDELREQYRGEALAIRAYVYHNMARTYGYEPGNTSNGPEANWNLAVMIREDATLDVSDAVELPRNTVAEVYTFIREDLAEAKTLLAGRTDNRYPTEALVDAIRARVELYAGNWSAASTAAQAAITNSGASLVSTEAGVGTMFKGPNSEAIWELDVNPSTEAIAGSNVNSGLAAYTSDQWVAQIPTQLVLDRYDAADYRLSGWFESCLTAQTTGATASTCGSVNSAAAALTKWNGWKGNLVDDVTLVRISEMYLIWAEAAAKAANSPAAGNGPLTTLKTARNAGATPAAALVSITAFEDEILDERVRELVGEGHRFWDLKRLGRNILDNTGDIKMRADAYRILAPFGTGEQNINSLLVENPGYAVSSN